MITRIGLSRGGKIELGVGIGAGVMVIQTLVYAYDRERCRRWRLGSRSQPPGEDVVPPYELPITGAQCLDGNLGANSAAAIPGSCSFEGGFVMLLRGEHALTLRPFGTAVGEGLTQWHLTRVGLAVASARDLLSLSRRH